VRAEIQIVINCKVNVQDEVNQVDSDTNEVDGMKWSLSANN